MVMILGCHDLTMFNNRNLDNTGKWRRNIKDGFRQLAEGEKPVIVLHHPHTTVTTGTWRNGWSTIRKTLPSVKGYAGAGRYHEPDRDKSEYSRFKEVLEATRKGNTIDFIVSIEDLKKEIGTTKEAVECPVKECTVRLKKTNNPNLKLLGSCRERKQIRI